MKLATFCLITTLFISAGCAMHAPETDWNDSQAIAAHISITRDDSQKMTTYQGPWYNKKETGWYLLRAWEYDNNENAIFQIYIRDHYSDDSGFFGTAYDPDGNKLPAVTIRRDDGSCIGRTCWLFNPLGINMDKEYLEKNKASGINIALFDKTGETDFFIHPAYIKALLDKVGKK